MTKPEFVKQRLKQLFLSDDIKEQQRIVENYNKIRTNECYCGHTIECDCSNPGIYEFQHSILTNSIPEKTLKKLL